ncbi:MAG: hypothetical protein N4A76_04430 [Firmicutes bacterium]|jgi:hypothetical protein|nr:hypothetical protein [Bacillota bacterium]
MTTVTEKLKLLKKDVIMDKDEKFNIEEMLNDNWDKIDENSVKVEDRITELENTKVKKVTFNITVPSSGWIDEGENGFSKTVSVQGVLEIDNPVAAVIMDGLTIDEKENLRAELAKIVDGVTLNGSLKFYAKEIPRIDLPILLEVIR